MSVGLLDTLAKATPTTVETTLESETAVRKLASEQLPDLRAVGWYHSHPKLGVFFSNTDEKNHALWGKDGIGIVVDPWGTPKEAVYRGPSCERLVLAPPPPPERKDNRTAQPAFDRRSGKRFALPPIPRFPGPLRRPVPALPVPPRRGHRAALASVATCAVLLILVAWRGRRIEQRLTTYETRLGTLEQTTPIVIIEAPPAPTSSANVPEALVPQAPERLLCGP